MDFSAPDLDCILSQTFVARAEYHASLASTNDRAAQCARLAGGKLPLLVLADQQTAGRGRGSNRWWTGRGSLAFSLLIETDSAGGDDRRGPSPLVSLAAAVAVVETLAPLLAVQTLGIRWPNDVVAGGGKLAGILVEVFPDRKCVVGIGVNTNNTLAEAPPELRRTAATLRDLTGREYDHTTLLVGLLRQLERALGQLGFEPERVAARADALCLQHGAMLTLQQGGRLVRGRCGGIAPDGALLLDTREGRQTFYSGVLRP